MRKSKIFVYSLTLLLSVSLNIFLAYRTAVARTESESGSPGKYLRILISPEQQSVQQGSSATFTVVVLNASDKVNLTDVVVKDLFAPDCNRNIGDLAADSNFPPYKCTLNNIQEPFVNWITVEGNNRVDGEADLASDSAAIDTIGLAVAVDAEPSEIPSPGGEIDFSVTISNTGSVAVALKSLTSNPFGDLTDPTNQLVKDNSCVPSFNLPLLPPNIGEECSFKADLLGEAGQIPIAVTARAGSSGASSVTETGVTFVKISGPVDHQIYFPLVLDTLDEPNDTCHSAFPLSLNQSYYFLPDDGDDWYFFDLTQAGDVLVELTNFVPLLGQIIVYDGGQCNSLQVLKNNGNDKDTKLIPLGIQPPGRYYILVINDGDVNTKMRYKLQIYFRRS